METDETKPTCSVVIPVYNSERSLPLLVERLHAVLPALCSQYEIILVNDDSRDGSWSAIQALCAADPRVLGIDLMRNFGQHNALLCGIRQARYELILTMDDDLQNPPEEIHRLLARLDEGWDLVSGWKQKRRDPLHKVIPSRLFNFITARAFRLKLKDYNCGFKAYRREVVKELDLYGEMHRYIPALAHSLGYRITEIPVEHRKREFGRSKYGLERYLRGFFDLLTVKMVTQYVKSPLYLFGRLGLVSALLGTAIMVWMAVLKIFYAQPISNRLPLFLGLTLILGGLQFISLGLISELIINRISPFKGLPVSVEKTVHVAPEDLLESS